MRTFRFSSFHSPHASSVPQSSGSPMVIKNAGVQHLLHLWEFLKNTELSSLLLEARGSLCPSCSHHDHQPWSCPCSSQKRVCSAGGSSRQAPSTVCAVPSTALFCSHITLRHCTMIHKARVTLQVLDQLPTASSTSIIVRWSPHISLFFDAQHL